MKGKTEIRPTGEGEGRGNHPLFSASEKKFDVHIHPIHYRSYRAEGNIGTVLANNEHNYSSNPCITYLFLKYDEKEERKDR